MDLVGINCQETARIREPLGVIRPSPEGLCERPGAWSPFLG